MVSYVVTCLLFVSLFTFAITYAGNEQDQLDDVQDQINQTQSDLKEGKKKESQLNAQIKDLESKINSSEKEIGTIQTNIASMQEQISTVKQNLVLVEQEMDEQNENLNQRLRAMYKNGNVGMIQILLGSDSITDFMSNMDMVQKIFDNDVEVLQLMEAQHAKVEAQKNQLESLQEQLVAQQKEESEKQQALVASRGEVANLKASVASDNKQLEEQIDELNAEADRLVSEIKKLQGDADYAGGELCWPSASSTRVTSPFGYRIHPILKVRKLHTGIDIGAASGTNVLAANSGTVIKAAWNNSYGNVIMIDHGGGIVTLYAHNSKLLVSTGDTVTRGQVIALVGSTGDSTGPHIHFEVRVNGEYKNPMDWF